MNTGLMLLIVNANLSELRMKIIKDNIDGPFNDYTPTWYPNCGYSLT